MANIIIKGPKKSWSARKDYLHRRRKDIAEGLKRGIYSKAEMNRGNEGEPEFDARVEKYCQWEAYNKPRMNEWNEINREFKAKGEEGRVHSIDDIREGKVKYD